MAFEESKWVWMDGDLIPWLNATTHVSAHALHYGGGINHSRWRRKGAK